MCTSQAPGHVLWATRLNTCRGSTASIGGLNAPSWWLGSGGEYSFKLNKITSYSTFPNQPFTLDSAQQNVTDQYIFDSSATDSFYQPPTSLAYTLSGKYPIIHAIQPDWSTLTSMGKKSIPLTNTNVAVQWATDRHIFHSLHGKVLWCGLHCNIYSKKNHLFYSTEKLCYVQSNTKMACGTSTPKHLQPVIMASHHNSSSTLSPACIQQNVSNTWLNSCMWPSSPQLKPPYLLPSKHDSSPPSPY